MKITPIDAARLTDKASAHEYLAFSLGFPAHYGKNLDALADCLSELPRDRAIIVINANNATEYAERVIDVLVEILGSSNRVFVVK